MTTLILSRARTPIASFQSSLSSLTAAQLGSEAIKAALEKSGLSQKQIENNISEVVMGQVLAAGAGQAPARQASLGASLPNSIPCTTVNKVCGSGMKAIMMADQSIRLGEAEVCVAGGMESMSNAPYLLKEARSGLRMGDKKVVDSMIADGLWDPYGNAHMGCFGDATAEKFKFTRENQDDFAKASYEKALNAQQNNLFESEICEIKIKSRKGDLLIREDEEPKNFKPEKFSTLRPAFGKDPEKNTVTATNASKLNDGAAALVLAGEDWINQNNQNNNLNPQAKILATATFAHEPAWFTTAPVGAIKLALDKANLNIQDIDLFEINEAFSNVTMAAQRELELSAEKVNIFGGAVALGHPIGCSGARIVATLITALKHKNSKYGCAAICLGGGEACAMVIESI